MVENYVGMGGRRSTESRRNIQYMTGKRADERERARKRFGREVIGHIQRDKEPSGRKRNCNI